MNEAVKYFTHIGWGEKCIQIQLPGENRREYYARIGMLRTRKNGELDMRYRTSRKLSREA